MVAELPQIGRLPRALVRRSEPVKRKRPTKGRGGKGATRKVAVQAQPRDRLAWLNRALIGVGVIVVLAAASQAWIKLQSIPVQQISVTGELEHTQREVVQEMVQPSLVGGFLGADLQSIRQQLEGLPWVYEATVRRKWPAALEIHVVEQLPIARWGEAGFLNHEGEIFHSVRGGDWQGLPLLSGPEDTARSLMGIYRRVMNLLTPLGIAVEKLAVDERGQVEAVLAGGTQLLMGSDRFLERMHRFVAVYRQELANGGGEVERIDLRYPNGIAVAFREPVQVAGR